MLLKLRLALQKLIKKHTITNSDVLRELDDYRELLNQHDEELKELYAMMDKFQEHQEELSMVLGNSHFFHLNVPLSVLEKKILMLLYASDFLLSASDVAHKLNLSEALVITYIEDLINKGIPVLKQQSLKSIVYYTLDSNFKRVQAKQNVLNSNPAYAQAVL
ncbi:HTH domain-containing protein [Candidatus Woesearchaeota archaeon]|nr:MAG: HTH domain-containing protein [Candidatus Woesearchaeota archaeon]